MSKRLPRSTYDWRAENEKAIDEIHQRGPTPHERIIAAKEFLVVDGHDGPPLSCDCYGGCWGDHSETWPRLEFLTKEGANEAYRLCHQSKKMGDNLPASERCVPYGSYVLSGAQLRFQTTELRDKHEKFLRGIEP